MTTIKIRLKWLEGKIDTKKKTGTDKMIGALHAIEFNKLCKLLEAQDVQTGSVPMPFHVLMSMMADWEEGPFVFERYRGLVPDENIRQAYNYRRNWYSNGDPKKIPDDAARILHLAGVIDEKRNLKQGYILLDNGCIADAPNK